MLDVDIDLINKNNIILKVAETEDELLQAFALVQAMYEKAKIVDESGTGLRLTKFHLLPTTKVLIAKVEDKVIATVTQIMDTPLGLPIDDFIPIDDIRSKSIRVCEISSLAIHSDWRSRSHGLFIPLSLYSIWYSKYVTGADELVIITNQRARYVYEDLFLFEPISINSQNYGSINDSQAFAQRLKLTSIENRLIDTYYRYPKNKNIYNMFSNPKWSKNLRRDLHKYKIVPVVKFDEQTLDKIFELFNNFSSLSDREKQVIYNHFSLYSKKYGENIFVHQRRHPRFYTKMKADIEVGSELYETECIQISKGGASFKRPLLLPLDKDDFKLTIYLDSHESCSFMGKVSWKTKFQIGFEADPHTTSSWEHYINYIELNISGFEQKAPHSA
jgi:hypothetical protein